MSGITLNITESWQGDLEKELTTLLQTEINPAVAKANDAVAETMREVLAQHIANDVYAEYSPKLYERRGATGGLIDMNKNADLLSDSTRAKIQYKPSGDHPSVSGWHKVDGDDLIGRIESHNPEYNWLPKSGNGIPDRPFWQNFVNEMVDGGTMETVWANALRGALPDGWTLDIANGGVQRDANDGNYG